jgi:hypothetical protein
MWLHYSKEMDMSGIPCIQNFSGGDICQEMLVLLSVTEFVT